MGDKVKVKKTMKWPITQEIVNHVRNRKELPKSPLFNARKTGCTKKLTFQLQLGYASVTQCNQSSVNAYCYLYLLKGDDADVTWVLQNTGLTNMYFSPKSGTSQYQRYSQYINISTGNELVCDLEVASTDWQEEDRNAISLKADLSELLQSGELSDVTLACNKKEFKCHRSILGARSSVFRTMLAPDNGFKEGQAKAMCKISIRDAEPKTFECFLTFLYGADIDLDDMEVTLDLLELAERYDVPTLKQDCSETLMDDLSSDNYWQCLSRCALLNVPDLVKEILKKAIEDPKDLRNNKTWLQLIKKCPELTVALLDVVEEKLTK